MHMKLGRFQRRRQYHKKQVKIALSGQTKKKNYQRRSLASVAGYRLLLTMANHEAIKLMIL